MTRFSRSLPACLIAFVLLVVCAQAEAQTRQIRVHVKECTPLGCRFITGYGWSACVGKDTRSGDWIFITAGHNLRDATAVDVADGVDGNWGWQRARIAEWYVDHRLGFDMGIIRYRANHELPSYQMAARTPATGTTVQFLHDNQQWTDAKIVERAQYVEIDRRFIEGDSGGPLVFRGLFVGIVSNYRGLRGQCTCAERVLQYLRQNGYRLERDPVESPESTAQGEHENPLPGSRSPMADPAQPPAGPASAAENAAATGSPPNLPDAVDRPGEGKSPETRVKSQEPEKQPAIKDPTSVSQDNTPPIRADPQREGAAAPDDGGIDWWSLASTAALIGGSVATGGGLTYLAAAKAIAPVAAKAVGKIVERRDDRSEQMAAPPPAPRSPLPDSRPAGCCQQYQTQSPQPVAQQSPQYTVEGGETANCRAPFPRRLDEARQLRELRQREGRIPEFDALVGMVVDDEANLVFERGTDSEKQIIKGFVDSVKARANSISPPSVESYVDTRKTG